MNIQKIIWFGFRSALCMVIFSANCSGQSEATSLSFPFEQQKNLLEHPIRTTGEVRFYFNLENRMGKDTVAMVNAGKNVPLLYLYRLENNRLTEVGRTGYEMPYSRQSLRGDKWHIPVDMPAFSRQSFFLTFKKYHDQLIYSSPFLETKENALLEYQSEENRQLPGKILELFLSGFFLAISVYSLLKFFSQSKDKVYLYYALVNFFCCIGTSVYYNIPNAENGLFPWIKNNLEICAIFSDITMVFNLLFISAFLELKRNAHSLYRVIVAYIIFHLFATIFFPVLASPPERTVAGKISFYLYPACELFCLAIYCVVVVYLWNRRKGYYKYLFYGFTILTFGMFLFTMSSIFRQQESFISHEGGVAAYLLLSIFMISEVCFFITALTQREKQTEINNARYQRELIHQLSAGRLLQENFTKDLERQVEERSKQILQHQELLEQERREKLLAELNRRISETELKALRSQMNPHFIFNSLNSIENFMMKNNKRMASDYFGKFASLIRIILDSSQTEQVSFAKDIEALDLYVELEQLRFDNRFSYKKIIDPVLVTGDFNVPSLLIQPYVENAILHGLSQSDKPGLALTITAALQNDYLIYTIEDNGIGRRKAEVYKKNKRPHKSMGLQITQERVNILNQQQNTQGDIEITDIYDHHTEPCGTRVQVRLKAIKYAVSEGDIG